MCPRSKGNKIVGEKNKSKSCFDSKRDSPISVGLLSCFCLEIVCVFDDSQLTNIVYKFMLSFMIIMIPKGPDQISNSEMKISFSSSFEKKKKKRKKIQTLNSLKVVTKKNYASNFSNSKFGPRSIAKKKRKKKRTIDNFTLVSDEPFEEEFSRFRQKRLDRDRKSYRFVGGWTRLVEFQYPFLVSCAT